MARKPRRYNVTIGEARYIADSAPTGGRTSQNEAEMPIEHRELPGSVRGQRGGSAPENYSAFDATRAANAAGIRARRRRR